MSPLLSDRVPGFQKVPTGSPNGPVSDLVAHVARFCGELRSVGVSVTLGDEIDAATSLAHVDIGDRNEVRLGLRTSLKVEYRASPSGPSSTMSSTVSGEPGDRPTSATMAPAGGGSVRPAAGPGRTTR